MTKPALPCIVSNVTISIDLSELQEEELRQRAKSLGIAPEELAKAAIADLLANQADDFEQAAERVLRKNEELYRRLA